jgi:hypothetical protein
MKIRNMQTNICLIFILIFSSISCKEKTNPVQSPQEETKGLIPLTEGNAWTYKETLYNSDLSISRVDTFKYSIKKDTVVNGVTWKLLSEIQWGYRNDSLGFHETNWEHALYTYLYPAKVGDEMNSYKVVSTDTLVNTPMGNLHCYKYQSVWFGTPLNTLIAPNIGIVRVEDTGSTQKYISEVKELIQVKIN